MSQPITRIYDNESLALDVVSELKKSGFASDSIHLVAASGVKATGKDDGIVAAIEAIGVSKAAAAAYAESVRSGRVVVAVTPNFGTGRRATLILDKFNPIAVAVSEPTGSAASSSAASKTVPSDPSQGWEGPTPLSSSLTWPVLLDDPTPLSTKANWPVLSDDASPLSTRANWPVLSDNATPLSSWLKLSILKEDSAPFSNWLKRPLLSDNATPFSDWLKVRVLSDDPAPFSNWLHWPTASKADAGR